jgi:Mn-dependent DtxR family transcriptional regulator
MDPSIAEQIKYLRDKQKLRFSQIAEILGLERRTVSKAYFKNLITITNKGRSMKLDAYRDLIAAWFQDCSSLKSSQVWERLKERKVIVDEKTVSRFTREFRIKKTKIHYPLEFLPGEEAQVDWFFDKHPLLGKLCGFVMILS